MPSSGKRRWFQFRLRTILLLVIVASLALAPLGMRLDRIRRQQPAIVAVENAGGAVWIVRKPVNSPTPFPGLSTVYDSQRRDAGALWQVVEDAQYGEAVCVCFPSASPNSQLGNWSGAAVSVDGQDVAMHANGEWYVHGNSRELWRNYHDRRQQQPFAWSTLEALPYLKILDLGDRPVSDEDLKQIGGTTDLHALLARNANVTDEGLAFAGRLKGLRILSLGGAAITDAGLKSLAGLERLEVLELDHSQIRGGGLKHLAAMSQLKLLSLRHTPLTDEGLEQLAKLTELRRLYFYDTAVTDAGLARLRPLKKLEILHLGKTGVTFAGADEFEKDLPRSPIIR
ncbi:MAG TPA: hypothetical protein VHC19_14025 [Pirellulales bacterium]|nr:hypothetical protein [Pirellulales bacterium]